MSHVIILARTTAEGNAFAREHRGSLPRGRTIVPTSAAQISGVVPHEVIELAGFAKRPDRHAVLAAVKRSSRRYQGVKWTRLDERGPATERQHEVAARYDRLRDLAPADADVLEERPADERLSLEDALAEAYPNVPADEGLLEQRKRRRSRCKDCGTLHLSDEACPTDLFIGTE